ncbi:MAG: DUF4870 domain-containing protein [Xanthomonadales bacterium]|jgi:hypothetical protein|nr:DUF4870 domain-containing protein [Xanthomonadales bacterium]
MHRTPPPWPTAPDPDRIAPPWRSLCTLLHLSALAGYLIPFANFVIPLVIWILKKDEAPDIDRCGREVLNFNLTMLLAFAVSWLLLFVLIGFLLLPLLWIYGLVVTIIAAVRSNDGQHYRYPFCLRFF